jgi:hypothetical protein
VVAISGSAGNDRFSNFQSNIRDVYSYGEEIDAVLQSWQTEQKDNGNLTPSWELWRWIFLWFYRSVSDYSEQCSRDRSVAETVLACNLRT